MTFFRGELVVKLIRNGITHACGKPLNDASFEELMDEWSRFVLRNRSRIEHRRYQHDPNGTQS
ncbi:hypothetical protein G3578_04790 [Brevibacillus sp. SYP-B805]|uniref:hypothetical protein n=1 Tax=Brevibacillus sp. SYP-B805 TaxID=1578199 RepID=UPI0013EC01FD|nr:hypothetical protein [Brevibacillus sp. SYP-B805]NGQ94495.1 hypothetical protein [Brevibacillus sp. SYP-B805]